jgi:hypothetical protein
MYYMPGHFLENAYYYNALRLATPISMSFLKNMQPGLARQV